MHPNTASAKASWDFVEETEDEPGDIVVMGGDISASQACKISWATILRKCCEKSTGRHRVHSSNNTVSYQYTSDHWRGFWLPQKIAICSVERNKKQNVKPHNPFRHEKSDSGIVSKLSRRKPWAQNRKSSRKSKRKRPWWASETEKAWTGTCAAVKIDSN